MVLDFMGVNIYILRVDFGETTEVDSWDHSRFAGDSELYRDETIEWEYPDGPLDEIGIVKRPANWVAFGEWIAMNVPEPNKPRWREAAKMMIEDSKLFLQFVS